jgi:hypothetical protein
MSLTGVWMNELKSILLLDEDENGTLAGKFRSMVGRDPHVRILTGKNDSCRERKANVGLCRAVPN